MSSISIHLNDLNNPNNTTRKIGEYLKPKQYLRNQRKKNQNNPTIPHCNEYQHSLPQKNYENNNNEEINKPNNINDRIEKNI